MEPEKILAKWAIGTIVALDSHIYFDDDESKSIVICGEPKQVSPLMIIIEVVVDKPMFEERSGMRLSDISSCQCRCIWFSHKSYIFEEVWISSKLLKIIKPAENIDKVSFGQQVELKTAYIELGKIKSNIKETDNNVSSILTSDLNFVSPVMQVIGTAKSESKEPLYDVKTLTLKRSIPKSLVKCKYYNAVSDKFSEFLIPIEALNIIDSIDEKNLVVCKTAIIENQYLAIEHDGIRSITKPNRINFNNGRYYIYAYDYLTVKNVQLNINKIKVELKDNYYNEVLPIFEVKRDKLIIKPIDKKNIKELFKKIGKDKYITISYENRDGDKSNRSISDYELVESVEKNLLGEDREVVYLKAFYHLRNAERFFRIERIKSLKVLA